MSNDPAASRSLAIRAVLGGVAMGSCLLVLSCATGSRAAPGGSVEEVEVAPMVGPATQSEILAANPDWVDALVGAQPEEEASLRLAGASPGREVVVFFGSWCSDSRRELTRLWRAVDIAGGDLGVPIRYVGVDRSKTEPAELVEGVDLRYVPTLIVLDRGVESGRIVESAPRGVEVDLVALLTGEASGWLSGRSDLEIDEPAEIPR